MFVGTLWYPSRSGATVGSERTAIRFEVVDQACLGTCPSVRSESYVLPRGVRGLTDPILASVAKVTIVTTASDVAEAVYCAATDVSGQLRFPAGPDCVALAQAR